MVENKVSGKKYRILVDSINDIWDRISFWTKASDVEFEDGSTLEGKSFGHAMLERSKTYSVGDIVYCSSAPSWCMFKCSVAGTTAEVEPTTYTTISSSGTEIVDGTAKFQVYDVRPATSMSYSQYMVPTVGLVNTQINNIATWNGQTFYFDYRSGQYGFNTSPSRGADTFHPFSSTSDYFDSLPKTFQVGGFSVNYTGTWAEASGGYATTSFILQAKGKVAVTCQPRDSTFTLSRKEDDVWKVKKRVTCSSTGVVTKETVEFEAGDRVQLSAKSDWDAGSGILMTWSTN